MNKSAQDKSSKIEAFLENLAQGGFGRSRHESMAGNKCVQCGGPAVDFKDDVSKREYKISRMCQQCQDKFFDAIDGDEGEEGEGILEKEASVVSDILRKVTGAVDSRSMSKSARHFTDEVGDARTKCDVCGRTLHKDEDYKDSPHYEHICMDCYDPEHGYPGEFRDAKAAVVDDIMRKVAQGTEKINPDTSWMDVDTKSSGEANPESANELLDALKGLVRVFTEGKNYEQRNPYSRPEVKAALRAIQKASVGGDTL